MSDAPTWLWPKWQQFASWCEGRLQLPQGWLSSRTMNVSVPSVLSTSKLIYYRWIVERMVFLARTRTMTVRAESEFVNEADITLNTSVVHIFP